MQMVWYHPNYRVKTFLVLTGPTETFDVATPLYYLGLFNGEYKKTTLYKILIANSSLKL